MLVDGADHPISFERSPLLSHSYLCDSPVSAECREGPSAVHLSVSFLVPTSILAFPACNFYVTLTRALFVHATSAEQVRVEPLTCGQLIGASSVRRRSRGATSFSCLGFVAGQTECDWCRRRARRSVDALRAPGASFALHPGEEGRFKDLRPNLLRSRKSCGLSGAESPPLSWTPGGPLWLGVGLVCFATRSRQFGRPEAGAGFFLNHARGNPDQRAQPLIRLSPAAPCCLKTPEERGARH